MRDSKTKQKYFYKWIALGTGSGSLRNQFQNYLGIYITVPRTEYPESENRIPRIELESNNLVRTQDKIIVFIRKKTG